MPARGAILVVVRVCVWALALCVGRTDDECGMVRLIPVFPVHVWYVWSCTGDLLLSPELPVCVCPLQVRSEDRDR